MKVNTQKNNRVMYIRTNCELILCGIYACVCVCVCDCVPVHVRACACVFILGFTSLSMRLLEWRGGGDLTSEEVYRRGQIPDARGGGG